MSERILFEPGPYHAIIRTAAVNEENNKCSVFVGMTVTGRIIDGALQNFDTPIDRTMFFSLEGEAYGYTVKKLRALGWVGNDFADIQLGELATNTGVGVICKHDEYQGQTKEKWELASWGGLEAKPAAANTLRTLNAKLKSASGSYKAAAPPAPPARPTASTPAKPAAAPARPAQRPAPVDPIKATEAAKDAAWGKFVARGGNNVEAEFWKAVDEIEKANDGMVADLFGPEEWAAVGALAGAVAA